MGRIVTQENVPFSEVYRSYGGEISIYLGDSLRLYDQWDPPVVIISDGPYGIAGFPGDLPTPDNLAEWYEPHIQKWSEKATPLTTLWFWNTELGWATVHPVLVQNGWSYRCCHIWNKGIGHVAGNSNTKSLRKLPVVSEVCVQYVKEPYFENNGRKMSMQEWLRHEWERSGIPLNKTNEICGVKNAATRKYLTKCHLWYYPPVEAFEKLVCYANLHGKPNGKPYFSIDGVKPLTAQEWELMRAKFYCEAGFTNVWNLPPVRGKERLKTQYKCLHTNQKPLELIDLIVRLSSDPGDMVWEPFGGLCTAGVASLRLGRRCISAEILPEFYRAAIRRLENA